MATLLVAGPSAAVAQTSESPAEQRVASGTIRFELSSEGRTALRRARARLDSGTRAVQDVADGTGSFRRPPAVSRLKGFGGFLHFSQQDRRGAWSGNVLQFASDRIRRLSRTRYSLTESRVVRGRVRLLTAFVLDARAARWRVRPGISLSVSGLRVGFTRSGARAFNAALGTRAFRPGLRFGTIAISLERALVVTGGTMTITFEPAVLGALGASGVTVGAAEGAVLAGPGRISLGSLEGSVKAATLSGQVATRQGIEFSMPPPDASRSGVETMYPVVEIADPEVEEDPTHLGTLGLGTGGVAIARLGALRKSPAPVGAGEIAVDATLLERGWLGDRTSPPVADGSPVAQLSMRLTVR